jgi:hypothetical protein
MGGSTPKGEAPGECASVLPERDRDANETLACQSKAFRGNKTKNKTVFRRAHWKETPGATAQRLALSKRSKVALNSRSVSAGLRAAFNHGEVRFVADQFDQALSVAAHTDWVVYAKPPFGGPEQVLKYLARYTHRVAISNARLLGFEDGKVRFRYRDYAHGNRKRVMTLTALEFVRRLLLHVLPTGFQRIRHYGILANRHRQAKLALCRQLLGSGTAAEPEFAEETREPRESLSLITPTRVCPVCGAGRMIVIKEFPPMSVGAEAPEGVGAGVGFDSS